MVVINDILWGNVWGHWETCRNKASTTTMFLNLSETFFLSWEEILFPHATMFPVVGKLGNIDWKHNVFAAMFPSLPTALVS